VLDNKTFGRILHIAHEVVNPLVIILSDALDDHDMLSLVVGNILAYIG
jgi:hypothetical protein